MSAKFQSLESLASFLLCNKIFKELDANNISVSGKENIIKTLSLIDKILGIVKTKDRNSKSEDELKVLIQKREDARASKDWALADQIRDEIDQLGYIVEDTLEGPIAKRK